MPSDRRAESFVGNGTVCMNSMFAYIASLNFEPGRLLVDELNLTGCRCATRQEIRESLELVRRKLVRPAIPNVFPLGEANKVQRLIDDMSLLGRTVLVMK